MYSNCDLLRGDELPGRVPTGLPEVDALTGGLPVGWTVVWGEPGSGASVLAGLLFARLPAPRVVLDPLGVLDPLDLPGDAPAPCVVRSRRLPRVVLELRGHARALLALCPDRLPPAPGCPGVAVSARYLPGALVLRVERLGYLRGPGCAVRGLRARLRVVRGGPPASGEVRLPLATISGRLPDEDLLPAW